MMPVPDPSDVGTPAAPAPATSPEARLALFNGWTNQGIKAGLVLFFAFLAATHWSFISGWLEGITHAELPFGVEFDRQAVIQNINSLSSTPDHPFNSHRAIAAANEAALLGAAIQGAKVLWVDPHPEGNSQVRGILEGMGITVALAWSTKDVENIMSVPDERPDLIISNVRRDGDGEGTKLSKCRATYFDFPDPDDQENYNGDLGKFNAHMLSYPNSGFSMAEDLANLYPDLFGQAQKPRIIFYSGSAGGLAADQCARVVTNRPDVLLENVVSALASIRSNLLPMPPAPPAQCPVNKKSGQ